MKVLILCGGYGTRLSEETNVMPKPMVNIGDKPIVWHIMKYYSNFGFSEFILLLGYKGNIIKSYFESYYDLNSDFTIDLRNNRKIFHNSEVEPWRVTLLDTGLNTMTGGRIKKAAKYLNDETFLLTYGDGLSDVNIIDSIKHHKRKGLKLTMTVVQPAGRFGSVSMNDDQLVNSFEEKPKGDSNWINGGFFVCEPSVIDYIDGSDTVFEQEPLKRLSTERELSAYKHHGFWHCMDNLSDKKNLNDLWHSKTPPWKIW